MVNWAKKSGMLITSPPATPKLWFMTFANFLGVNTSALADSNLLVKFLCFNNCFAGVVMSWHWLKVIVQVDLGEFGQKSVLHKLQVSQRWMGLCMCVHGLEMVSPPLFSTCQPGKSAPCWTLGRMSACSQCLAGLPECHRWSWKPKYPLKGRQLSDSCSRKSS